jgi:DNA polymerase elongation subunit (family B)
VVPRLLTDLLDARRHALATGKKDDTPAAYKRVLDARQKALKASREERHEDLNLWSWQLTLCVGENLNARPAERTHVTGCSPDRTLACLQLCANSVYGFFGASVNSLFARELGDSTLSLGREYLLRAVSLVHEHFRFLKVE